MAKRLIRRRGFAVVLTCTMMVLATACGKTVPGAAGSEPIDTTIDKNLVYKESLLDISSTSFRPADIDRVFMTGSKIRVLGQSSGENGTGELFVVTFDTDGTNPSGQVLAETNNNFDYMSPVFDDDGNLYVLKLTYQSDASNTEDAGDTASESREEGAQGTDGASTVDNAVQDGIQNETSESVSDGAADGAEGVPDETVSEDGESPASGTDPYDEGSMYDSGVESMAYSLVKIDSSGNRIFDTPLDISKYEEEYGFCSISYCRFLKDLGVVLETNAGLLLYSSDDGSFVRELYKVDSGAYVDFRLSGDGTYYTLINGSSEIEKIDLQTSEVGEPISVPSDLSNQGFFVSPGVGCDFYAAETDGIVSWNVGDETTQRRVGFTESDIAIESIDDMAGIDDNHILISYSTTDINGEYTVICSILEKVNAEDIVDKKVLTIGVNEVDTQLRNMIVSFNKKSDAYKLKLIDYSHYNTDEDFLAGTKKFNADLISGNAPDMMYMDMGQALQALEAKGVFEPLDEYIANDPEISQKEFLDNILEVYRYKGKTYMMVPSFTAYTYAMKKSEADRLRAWNLQSLSQMILKEKLDKALIFGFPLTKSQFLQMSLIYDANSYMDWNSGEAKFKETQFMNLLDFAKDLPDNAQDYLTVDSWQELESAFRRDKAIVAQGIMNTFLDFTKLKYGTFGADISFVGFPREENVGGGSVSASCLVSMNVDASDKDGCWQFMRGFYLDEFQDSVAAQKQHFPVGKTQMESLAEEATHRPFYTDGDGKRQEFDIVFEVSGQQITIPVLSEADKAQMFAYFDSVDTAVNYDNVVYNIIMEEAAPFFQGEKTAEECANIIQSKVQIYMDENS